MDAYAELHQFVINGNRPQVVALTQGYMDEGKPVKEILQSGLLPGMKVVGEKFQSGEFFIPEMLLAARALNAGLDLLKPFLEEVDIEPVARVVIGTVKGDIHDIGKNLVAIMLRGGGFEVIDAGVDVTPEKFVDLVKEHEADVLGLSALLTTTMPGMKTTIEALEAAGVRDQVKVIIGGAPITNAYAEQIKADGFARDASAAVDLVHSLI